MSTKPQSTEEQLKGLLFLYDNKIIMAYRSSHKIELQAQAGAWLISVLTALLTASNREAIRGLQEILDKPIDSTTRIDLEYLLATLKGEKV